MKKKQCAACGYKTNCKEYSIHTPGVGATEPKVWLCALCSATACGCNITARMRDGYEMLATICHVGNAILDELRKAKR